jgi:hypothetical protein
MRASCETEKAKRPLLPDALRGEKQQQIPCGNDNKKGKGKSKGDSHRQRQQQIFCGAENYWAASSLARAVARITALISVTRRPPSSSSRMPSIVHPAGVVTASFSSAG